MRINTFGWVAAVKVTCHTMVQVQGGTHIGLVVVEYIEFYPAYRILYGQRWSWMVNGFKMRWMLIDGHLMAADCLYLTFLRYECWGKILTPWNMWHALVRELFIFCRLHSLIGTIYLQIISFFSYFFLNLSLQIQSNASSKLTKEYRLDFGHFEIMSILFPRKNLKKSPKVYWPPRICYEPTADLGTKYLS